MGNAPQYAVVQKESTAPTADQLKRAFSSFSNLTDADAVRLATGARGILMRHLGHDAARALQSALQGEGIGSAVVAENDLPKLPDSKSLHRIELTSECLAVYDLLGRPTGVPWQDVALIAAGAVRHFEVSKTEHERVSLRVNLISGVSSKKVTEISHKVESDSQLILEILLAGRNTRYQIAAAEFPFKYVIDRPDLPTAGKFAWLVREISTRAPSAMLNTGARSLCSGADNAGSYINRQALTDEIVWLLWQASTRKREGAS